MAKSMRADGFGFQAGTEHCRFFGIPFDDVSNAEAGNWSTIGIKEDIFIVGIFRRTIFQVIFKGLTSFRPEGSGPLFSSFPEELDLSELYKSQIADSQIDDFLNPGTGIVQEQE